MKALLVVDVPDDLIFNKLFLSDEIRYTINSEYEYQYFLKDINNCLLKPIPEKKDYPGFEAQGYSEYEARYCDGYNDCIDEILEGLDLEENISETDKQLEGK